MPKNNHNIEAEIQGEIEALDGIKCDLNNATDDEHESITESEGEEEMLFKEEYVKKLRKECSKYRLALKDVQSELERYKNDMPLELRDDYTKAKEELGKLKEILSEKIRKEEKRAKGAKEKELELIIESIAASNSAVSPKQVADLLKDKVDLDESGEAYIVGQAEGDSAKADDYIKEFLRNNLHLVKTKSKKRGANSTPSSENLFTIEQISMMSAKQYERNRGRILKSLSQSG